MPAFGHVLVVAGLALFVSLKLHVRAAAYLALSYDMLPPGQLPLTLALSSWETGEIARAFALGFSLAAPFLIASLIYNVALGAINRAMPQLMVSFVGAPAITAGGLILLLVTAPLALSIWARGLGHFMGAPFGAVP